jgi:hypothetical protein
METPARHAMRGAYAIAAFLAAACATPIASARTPPPANEIACTLTSGGETTVVKVRPTAEPYRVEAVKVGSRFLFKAVWTDGPDDEAAVSIMVHHPAKDGPLPLHQLKYTPPWPATPPGARYGFTGRQVVYEPSVAADLQYWCDWVKP